MKTPNVTGGKRLAKRVDGVVSYARYFCDTNAVWSRAYNYGYRAGSAAAEAIAVAQLKSMLKEEGT